MEHTLFECACNNVGCTYCEGRLRFCTTCKGRLRFCATCKGGEGSLTIECCGRPITEQEEYDIYNKGILNFVNNRWFNFEEECIIKYYNASTFLGDILEIGVSITHIDTQLCVQSHDAMSRANNVYIAKSRFFKEFRGKQ